MHIMRFLDRVESLKQDKNKNVFFFFVDFKSAFDSVNHEILLEKLKSQFQVNEKTINFTAWYLNQLQIRIGNESVAINKGAPQGGVCSPKLWTLYMNDLLLELESKVGTRNVFAYADDLLIVAENRSLLDTTIDTVQRWAQANIIDINYGLNKTAILNFKPSPNLKLLGEYRGIKIQSDYTYLGVSFNDKVRLSFTHQKFLMPFNDYKHFTFLKTKASITTVYNYWKMYFKSKIQYNLITLPLSTKTDRELTLRKIHRAIKTSIGLAKGVNNCEIAAVLKELKVEDMAKKTVLRNIFKCREFNIRLENERKFLEAADITNPTIATEELRGIVKSFKKEHIRNNQADMLFGSKFIEKLHEQDTNGSAIRLFLSRKTLFRSEKTCRTCKKIYHLSHILECPEINIRLPRICRGLGRDNFESLSNFFLTTHERELEKDEERLERLFREYKIVIWEYIRIGESVQANAVTNYNIKDATLEDNSVIQESTEQEEIEESSPQNENIVRKKVKREHPSCISIKNFFFRNRRLPFFEEMNNGNIYL